MLINRSRPRGDYHGQSGVVWAADIVDLVQKSEVIVVSVRPGDWPGLGLRAEGKLLISFMAGVDFSRLADSGGRVVRAMPNAAAEIGASYSPFWAGPGVCEETSPWFGRFFQRSGPRMSWRMSTRST